MENEFEFYVKFNYLIICVGINFDLFILIISLVFDNVFWMKLEFKIYWFLVEVNVNLLFRLNIISILFFFKNFIRGFKYLVKINGVDERLNGRIVK